jgi:hypothetical protein
MTCAQARSRLLDLLYEEGCFARVNRRKVTM